MSVFDIQLRIKEVKDALHRMSEDDPRRCFTLRHLEYLERQLSTQKWIKE